MSAFQGARQNGFFGGGALGLGGGMNNPGLLLTAPLVEGGSGAPAPPSPAVFSSSSVQQALKTLQTDVETDVPSGARPTHASVGALQDDLQAIRKGTLSGAAGTTKIQADQAAILTSMGLTQDQVTQIQSDQQALQTAITAASANTSAITTSSGTSSSGTTTVTTSGSTTTTGTQSAVQSAFQTLQSDLQSDTPSGSSPSHAAIGTVLDDLDAIRKGTLSGSTAVTQVQTDAAAVLSSMGLTTAQVSQIQSDQQALATAIAADPNSPTNTTTSSTSSSTLQSVSQYLVGLPGLGIVGDRGVGIGMGPGGGPGFDARGGFAHGMGGAGPRGGMMTWG